MKLPNPHPARALERVTRAGAGIAGWMVLASAFAYVSEIVARSIFGISLLGIDEVVGYLLAVSMGLGFSHALVQKAHIRVEVVRGLLPAKLQTATDVVAMLLTIATLAVIVSFALGTLRQTIELGASSPTALHVPLWIPQSLWFATLCIFLFIALAVFILAMTALWRGDEKAVSELIGIAKTDD